MLISHPRSPEENDNNNLEAHNFSSSAIFSHLRRGGGKLPTFFEISIKTVCVDNVDSVNICPQIPQIMLAPKKFLPYYLVTVNDVGICQHF